MVNIVGLISLLVLFSVPTYFVVRWCSIDPKLIFRTGGKLKHVVITLVVVYFSIAVSAAITNGQISPLVTSLGSFALSNTLFLPFFLPRKISNEDEMSWIDRFLINLKAKLLAKIDFKIISLFIASIAGLFHPLAFYSLMFLFGSSFLFFHAQAIYVTASNDSVIFTDIEPSDLAKNKNQKVYKRVKLLHELRSKGPLFIIVCYMISTACCVTFVQGIEIQTFVTISGTVSYLFGVFVAILLSASDT